MNIRNYFRKIKKKISLTTAQGLPLRSYVIVFGKTIPNRFLKLQYLIYGVDEIQKIHFLEIQQIHFFCKN